MKKIKDFIYDKNDIIIAVLILVAAAAIITWRMDVILQYPKQLINSGENTTVEEPAGSSDNSTASDNSAASDNSDNTSDTNTSSPSDDEKDSDNSGTAGSDSSDTTALWADGTLTRDIEIDVTETTASAAVQCLVDAGLFTDYAEYKKACDDQGLDDEKVSAGAFTFAKGSTKAQIARKINWS